MDILWKLKLQVNKKFQEIVLKKFNNYLLEFCEKENIKIQIYDNIFDLNNKGYLKEENDLAVGKYICQRDTTTLKMIINDNYPLIKLTKNYNVFTLAHEIGHHLAIKNLNDTEEYIADKFIMLLAEECLTNIEQHILHISLSVFSKNENYPLPKITKKDLKEFKKLNNL